MCSLDFESANNRRKNELAVAVLLAVRLTNRRPGSVPPLQERSTMSAHFRMFGGILFRSSAWNPAQPRRVAWAEVNLRKCLASSAEGMSDAVRATRGAAEGSGTLS